MSIEPPPRPNTEEDETLELTKNKIWNEIEKVLNSHNNIITRQELQEIFRRVN